MTFATPEYHRSEEFQNRSRKLEEIESLGIDPYPHQFVPVQDVAEVLRKWEGQEIGHFDEAAAGTTATRVCGALGSLPRDGEKCVCPHPR